MRIISGQLGGRQFASPRSFTTHPMSDKIRGALFNILGDIDGLTILDAYAGSGAIGFEAISRGAASSTLIDNDVDAIKTIQNNIAELGIADKVTVVQASLRGWVKRNQRTHQFDVVIVDPPYNNLQLDTTEMASACVKPGGVFVVSLPPQARFIPAPDLEPLVEKVYGDAMLRVLRRKG
ncbi:MAG: methyltransferase [Candidatus Saccharibacteria bacterium]|nr:methyltransferase [Candidatus Saccharibacteria bacterium]